jgi:hypothetical protein
MSVDDQTVDIEDDDKNKIFALFTKAALKNMNTTFIEATVDLSISPSSLEKSFMRLTRADCMLEKGKYGKKDDNMTA